MFPFDQTIQSERWNISGKQTIKTFSAFAEVVP